MLLLTSFAWANSPSSCSQWLEDVWGNAVKERRESMVRQGCNYGHTDVEFFVLETYTGDGSSDFNDILNGKFNRWPAPSDCISALENAITKVPIFSGLVYRGVHYGPKVVEKHKVGAIVEYPAFTSSSINKREEYFSTHWLLIHSKTGKNISKCSLEYKGEEEVIFPPKTKFRVLSVAPELIELEEI